MLRGRKNNADFSYFCRKTIWKLWHAFVCPPLIENVHLVTDFCPSFFIKWLRTSWIGCRASASIMSWVKSVHCNSGYMFGVFILLEEEHLDLGFSTRFSSRTGWTSVQLKGLSPWSKVQSWCHLTRSPSSTCIAVSPSWLVTDCKQSLKASEFWARPSTRS